MEAQTDKNTNKSLIRRGIDKLVELARQKDPPRKIALGMALGIFIGILPIMGIQMAVVTIFALPLRGNLKAAIAGVWISNPITFIPMYWSYYVFGLLFVPSRRITWGQFTELITKAAVWDWADVSGSIQHMLNLGADILIPMWIGATILGVVFGIPTYFFTFQFVVKYRERRERRRQRKAMKK
ncbi:MAG: DUF2062 domain-containing protein [Proteobacteria bacterium]|nr:DUF2062 domain-containing protein [Pseudomonadota bacterium]